jgi:uncharacterized SAM-binding protein YcdF (DUF218 family)
MMAFAKWFAARRWQLALAAGLLLIACAAWMVLGPLPDPITTSPPCPPDAIVVLGGGNEDRIRQGKRLADRYPVVPVIVTGDGGTIVSALINAGIAPKRITHEQTAESTYDNAILTNPLLERLHARRVLLVTNWFHVPRSLAVFRRVQPGRDFAASFERKPEPLTPWNKGAQRRERVTALAYLIRFGVWSW